MKGLGMSRYVKSAIVARQAAGKANWSVAGLLHFRDEIATWKAAGSNVPLSIFYSLLTLPALDGICSD